MTARGVSAWKKLLIAAGVSSLAGGTVKSTIGPLRRQLTDPPADGDKVPKEVLKTLQSHPQTERLQWDHAEVIYNCPPCGMG